MIHTAPDAVQHGPHTVYPLAAQSILQRAAQTPVTEADPLARVMAIEKAYQQIRQLFPQFFRKDI